MEKAISSGFQFTGFFIEESHFKILSGSVKNLDLNLEINIGPEGTHYVKDKRFSLTLNVDIKDHDGSFECQITSRGEFNMVGDDEIISDYFYVNAPAIMFPYIRAYISTLTNLSTAGHSITLPTLRIDLKETLKSKIKIVD